jgi:D-alanyl-D-alanine carboxypeptidase
MLISTLLRALGSVGVCLGLHGCHRGSAEPVSLPAATPKPSAVCATLKPYLDSIQRAGRAPGMSLGIAMPDGGSCGIVAGLADTARRVPLQPQSLLLSGSIGKTYVAAVAMQLIAERRLVLDTLISAYIEREAWFDRLPNARTVRVRHLMNHTSGLVRYEFNPQFQKDLTAAPMRVWTPADRIAYLLDKPASFAAGEGWEYSDTNYIVLGLIIERITGRPLNAEIERRLLIPLKLHETRPSDSPTVAGLAQGYAGPRNDFGGSDAMLDANGTFVINPQFEWAGGGYASSARDLARWMTYYFQGRAYPDSLVRIATEAVPSRLGRDVKYGLGVIVRPSASGITWGHSGFFPGYVAEARYWPDHRIAVSLQVNTSAGGTLARPLGTVLDEVTRRLLSASR